MAAGRHQRRSQRPQPGQQERAPRDFGSGLTGATPEAAIFVGSAAQVLYLLDTGAGDSLRIRAGSFGCWVRSSRRGIAQVLLSKYSTSPNLGYDLGINSGNAAQLLISTNGTALSSVTGITDVCDDRWHLVVGTYDGMTLSIYVDGVLENSAPHATGGLIFQTNGPFNLGSRNGSAALGPTDHLFGRLSNAFLHPAVLTPEQIRLLYAAKIAHPLAVVPTMASLAVRLAARGADLVAADFPSNPLHLYTFPNFNDAGSQAVNLADQRRPVPGVAAKPTARGSSTARRG